MNIAGIAVKNVTRSPSRSLLTITGVAAAIVAFIVLRTVVSAWNAAADYSAKDRIATRHKLSFVIALPRRYVDVIREVDGVKQATWMNWFGGKDPLHPERFFPNYAVDARSFLEVYDEVTLPEADKERWRADRRGALVGSVLARQFGLKVGDKMTLEGSIFPGNWTFIVDGIYTSSRKSLDQSAMFFHWDYLNESLPPDRRDEVGWVASRIDEPGRGPEISAAIDRIFRERDLQTATMSERALNLSFLGMLSAILGTVEIVAVIILVILLMILSNTIAIGVRERTSEYGTLRALGFTSRHVRFFIIGESTTLGLLAGLLGVAIAWLLVNQVFSHFVEENLGGMFPYFRTEPSTLLLSLAIAVGLGAASGILPARRATRITVVDALRCVD